MCRTGAPAGYKTKKELTMSKLIVSAVAATLLLTTASGTMARPIHDPDFTDTTKPDGGYAPNSPAGVRAYWDYQDRWH
jgi:hypothetical protein